MDTLIQILFLLGVAVTIVVIFQKMHVPSSLAYLLVGLILGPFTFGPVVDASRISALAEFGIVFLLFTIGLNFSLPEIYALRNKVFGLGTGQVVLTTAIVGIIAWLAGLNPAAAFVVGAVFAQSSSTIIGKQLSEQGEDGTRHGRLGLAMSVFQDVTAVPFVVVIPVLGVAGGAGVMATELGWAMAKAVAAFALVFVAGRWLLRPLFHLVAELRSAEVFTLTVLFIALISAWTTNSLGLSLAFGAFLAGMMLGETEFRHQVESTIRPFRDVLLGLFFVGIGMLIDPSALLSIWYWSLLGAVVLLVSKTVLVALMVHKSGIDKLSAWRTGILLAVGGEFGFAVLSIALDSAVIDAPLGQIVLTAVLFSMIAGPLLIRHNHAIASWLVPKAEHDQEPHESLQPDPEGLTHLHEHVIICGFGRIGQSVAHLLDQEGIPYVAIDLDGDRVRAAHAAGEPVYYGDASQIDMLEALGLDKARLVVISYDDTTAALAALTQIRRLLPGLPVMVRTRDESSVEELQAAGALEVVPETLEAGLMIASQALLLLDVPLSRVMRRIQEQRSGRYNLMKEYFHGAALPQGLEEKDSHRLRSIIVPVGSVAVGRNLQELDSDGVTIVALVRAGVRQPSPPGNTILQGDDMIVVYGETEDILRVQESVQALRP